MSKRGTRAELLQSVMRAVAEFQDAADQVDEAAARQLGLNRTDLRCLGVLTREGAKTAGQLATAAGLTPGAATTAVDRLVRAGYVERARDEGDRRVVTIRATTDAYERVDRIWGPIAAESEAWLSRKSASDLAVILEFLQEGVSFQDDHAARITTRQSQSRRHG